MPGWTPLISQHQVVFGCLLVYNVTMSNYNGCTAEKGLMELLFVVLSCVVPVRAADDSGP